MEMEREASPTMDIENIEREGHASPMEIERDGVPFPIITPMEVEKEGPPSAIPPQWRWKRRIPPPTHHQAKR